MWVKLKRGFHQNIFSICRAPIVAVVVFYNRRYKSLNYAKDQRDGVVLFVVKLVVVCNLRILL